MSSPVVCVPPDMRLKDVAHLLVEQGISAVPVVDGGELVGIVSEADLVPLELAPDPRAHLLQFPKAPAGVPQLVAEVMTREVVALPEEADMAEAGRLMLERRIKSIPVLDGGRVVGIVARRDLLEVLARSDEQIAHDLSGHRVLHGAPHRAPPARQLPGLRPDASRFRPPGGGLDSTWAKGPAALGRDRALG
jgi:CBS domain-containing protein